MKPEIQVLIATTFDLIDQYEKADGDEQKLSQMRRFMTDIETFHDDIIETICTAISEKCEELLLNVRDTEPPEPIS